MKRATDSVPACDLRLAMNSTDASPSAAIICTIGLLLERAEISRTLERRLSSLASRTAARCAAAH